MFFALSGFLVTGSLQRVKLHQFMTLRLARLFPALVVEVARSALIIGPLVTDVSTQNYFSNTLTWNYFFNIVGFIQYYLPGVLVHNAYPDFINGQLWTIPFEFECYFSLVVIYLLSITVRREWFVAAVVTLCVVATAYTAITHRGISYDNHVPGRMLVISLLAAVSIYLYKDKLPMSNVAGLACLAVSVALLEYPELCFLAPFPVAYVADWLGLMRPPAIPFDDLSYGVFLFHFPVEQTIMYLLPTIHDWWLLAVLALPLTVGFAWLSWTLIEQPVLSRKREILAYSDRVVGLTGMRSFR